MSYLLSLLYKVCGVFLQGFRALIKLIHTHKTSIHVLLYISTRVYFFKYIANLSAAIYWRSEIFSCETLSETKLNIVDSTTRNNYYSISLFFPNNLQPVPSALLPFSFSSISNGTRHDCSYA